MPEVTVRVDRKTKARLEKLAIETAQARIASGGRGDSFIRGH